MGNLNRSNLKTVAVLKFPKSSWFISDHPISKNLFPEPALLVRFPTRLDTIWTCCSSGVVITETLGIKWGSYYIGQSNVCS